MDDDSASSAVAGDSAVVARHRTTQAIRVVGSFAWADGIRYALDESVPIPIACRLAQVSRRTLYNWIAKGKIVSTRRAGGTQYILVGSLFPLSRTEE